MTDAFGEAAASVAGNGTTHLGAADRALIVALDYPDADAALEMADRLDPQQVRVKVGKELFVRVGPGIVAALIKRGFEIFLDLKFHDIPNTVAGAVRAACEQGVWMVNVHVSGGPAMLMAARAAVDETGASTLLTGVTVLTSMDAGELAAIGINRQPEEQVLALTRLALDSGLDGVVCSANELALLNNAVPSTFARVTPGIRPAGSAADDQRRCATPVAAMRAGATHLVVGRPITRAADPAAAAAAIYSEIAAG